jgi:hypothetical protein
MSILLALAVVALVWLGLDCLLVAYCYRRGRAQRREAYSTTAADHYREMDEAYARATTDPYHIDETAIEPTRMERLP